jgi:hypothetical protein
MSDQGYSNSVRLQALALIAAAFVTTTGAVTSAFIQSGWITKPAVAITETKPRVQAMFTGMIEAVDERAIASNVEAPQSFNVQQDLVPPAAHLKLPAARAAVVEPQKSSIVGVNDKPRTIEPPRVLPANGISKPLMATGNWFSAIVPTMFMQPVQQPENRAQPKGTVKSNSRGASWNPLPR